MKKPLAKIIGVMMSLFVATGVAVAINSKGAVPVNATETTTTYTFISKSWEATSGGNAANWTSGSDGSGFSNNGIQVTTTSTGANGTSPKSFTNVSKIILTYNTNKSKGAGTASVKIGSNSETSKAWAYSGSADGTSANFTLQYDYNTTQSGAVKITLNTTTNSIYLVSCAITTSSGGGSGSSSSSGSSEDSSSSVAPATYTVTYNENGATSGSVPTDSNEYNSGASVTVLGNTGELAKTGYVWGGWNTAVNGSGTSYASGDSFNISENTTLYARWFSNHANDNEVIVTAPYLNLNSTGITSAATLTATDGMQYMAAPNGASTSVKATSLSGKATNNFNSDSPILMGKEGAYLYNKDPFQKSIARIEVYINQGASASAAIAINFGNSAACTTSYTDDSQLLNPDNAVYTFDSNVANAKYFRIQVTAAANVQIQAKVKFVIPATSVGVSPTSVTLAPSATQQLTTTVLPANTTDSLSYLSSDDDVATVSDEGLITAVAEGTATITATSGSCSATCAVTVENSPVITPDDSSIEGFTGDSEAIGFTYGYLNGSLSVSVKDSNVEAAIQNDNGTNRAEVLISFVNAGSSEVYLKDGSTTLTTIEVSITASAVTITGMPSTKLLRNGGTLNLSSLITINAVGVCSNSVTWSTSAGGIASVTPSGVVTGVSDGDAVITVTPNDYPAGAVSCTVTVAKVVFAMFGTDDSNGSSVTTDEAVKNIDGYVIESNFKFSSLANCYASANKSMKFGSGSSKGSITVGLADGKVGGKSAYITRIVVSAKTYNTDSTTINIAGESKALTDEFVDYSVDFGGYNTRTVTIEASGSENQRFRISNIYLYYEINVKETIRSNSDTLASLAYNYTQTGPNAYTFSKTSIRFGGFMDKALWDRLDNESSIEGFGVLVSTPGYLGSDSFEEWYEFFDGEIVGEHTQKDVIDEIIDGDNIKGFYTEISGVVEHPAEATDDQKAYMGVDVDDDYYVWTFRKNIAEADLTSSYVGVAFIVIDGDIVFLQQTEASASDLAQDLIDNTDCTALSYDGSLGYLAGL